VEGIAVDVNVRGPVMVVQAFDRIGEHGPHIASTSLVVLPSDAPDVEVGAAILSCRNAAHTGLPKQDLRAGPFPGKSAILDAFGVKSERVLMEGWHSVGIHLDQVSATFYPSQRDGRKLGFIGVPGASFTTDDLSPAGLGASARAAIALTPDPGIVP